MLLIGDKIDRPRRYLLISHASQSCAIINASRPHKSAYACFPASINPSRMIADPIDLTQLIIIFTLKNNLIERACGPVFLNNLELIKVFERYRASEVPSETQEVFNFRINPLRYRHPDRILIYEF